MQQHKSIDIEEIIEIILSHTTAIAELLNAEEKLSPENLDKVKELYSKREGPLKKMKEWYFSKDGRNFVLDFPGKWNEIIDPIMELDKQNLVSIQRKLEDISFQLKSLIKSKSLLIYSKEI